MLQIKVINYFLYIPILDDDYVERESAMKILNDVLQKPIMGYDPPIQQQVSRPSSKRRDSASRKLGRTRTPHQRIPCEICEKQLIKNHVWNLTQ
jgi:hypothetical protein